MSCYCDYDPATIYNPPKMVRAAKQHICDECGCTISKGETHEYVSYLYEGQWSSPRTCQGCLDVMAWVGAHIPCFLECRTHGDMLERADEAIDEWWTETVGLKFGWLRRRHKLRMKADADRKERKRQKEIAA